MHLERTVCNVPFRPYLGPCSAGGGVLLLSLFLLAAISVLLRWVSERAGDPSLPNVVAQSITVQLSSEMIEVMEPLAY
jgi:hypothetical protein